jgi:hypothetical protein
MLRVQPSLLDANGQRHAPCKKRRALVKALMEATGMCEPHVYCLIYARRKPQNPRMAEIWSETVKRMKNVA